MSQNQEEYNRRLDAASSEIRYDPLRDAVHHALIFWDQEDHQEKNDLSEEFWAAMGQLRSVFQAVQRGQVHQ